MWSIISEYRAVLDWNYSWWFIDIFVVCLVGVWQRNFEPLVCVCMYVCICVCVCVCVCVRYGRLYYTFNVYCAFLSTNLDYSLGPNLLPTQPCLWLPEDDLSIWFLVCLLFCYHNRVVLPPAVLECRTVSLYWYCRVDQTPYTVFITSKIVSVFAGRSCSFLT
jgi:hypothetical protein